MREHGGRSEEADPFARLAQTHRRLEERLKQLVQAAEDLAAGIGVSSALADIEDVAGFLSRGAVRHVDDEEHTLFPRIQGFKELAEVIAALETEHKAHRVLEGQIRELAEKWGGNVDAAQEDAAHMLELAIGLSDVYDAHIAREENELFPRARELLDAKVIAEMGMEMMNRRPDRGKDQR
jgi:hemerythrin-like domain-containing protein